MGSTNHKQASPLLCKNTFYDLIWILEINPKGIFLSIINHNFCLTMPIVGCERKWYIHTNIMSPWSNVMSLTSMQTSAKESPLWTHSSFICLFISVTVLGCLHLINSHKQANAHLNLNVHSWRPDRAYWFSWLRRTIGNRHQSSSSRAVQQQPGKVSDRRRLSKFVPLYCFKYSCTVPL